MTEELIMFAMLNNW